MNGVADQPATLGRYFLTAAYLMVNHDAGTFTLWQGNPTQRSKLVQVYDQKTADECGKDGTGIVQPTASAGPDDEVKEAAGQSDASPSSPPSGAVIGGAVAGAVVLIAVLYLGAFFFLRQKRKTVTKQESSAPPEYVHYDKAGFPAWPPSQEVAGCKPMPAEAEGQSHFVYELDGDGHGSRR